jgi:threonine dehydratase
VRGTAPASVRRAACTSASVMVIKPAFPVSAGGVTATVSQPAPKLSALTGAEVFVKYENMQVTNSFKDRGDRDAVGQARRHAGPGAR